MLSPEVLAEAASEVGVIAEAEGTKIALIGGLAMQMYGSDRLTGDVDIAAEVRIHGLRQGTALSFGGEQTHSSAGVPVDIVVRDDDFASLYEDAVDHAIMLPESPIPVADPEHIAAMKMVAGRSKDSADLAFLIVSGVVDPAKAKRLIRKHLGPYAANEFDRIVEEAIWKASTGRS